MAGADPSGALAEPRYISNTTTGEFIGIDVVTGQWKVFSGSPLSPPVEVTNFPPVQPVSVDSLPLPSGASQETGILTAILNEIRRTAPAQEPPKFLQANNIDNVLNPVAVTQSGPWNVSQSGIGNVAQASPWTVTLDNSGSDGTGIVISQTSIGQMNTTALVQKMICLQRAQIQWTMVQASGGGFVPYELLPF